MKYTALFKDTFREIIKSKNRFISILLIVGLGCGFFAGIKATGPDMLLSASSYYEKHNLMDINLKSTYGFDDKDIQTIKDLNVTKEIYTGYTYDYVLVDDENSYVVKGISYNPNKKINLPLLNEGRLPENNNEIVVEKSILTPSIYKIGNTITLEDPDDTLKTKELKIVGIVDSPLYISFDRGNTTLGSGSINSFLIMYEDNFKLDVYTDLFIILNDTKQVQPYTNKYNEMINKNISSLDKNLEISLSKRFHDIKNKANAELEENRLKYTNEKHKTLNELDNAKQKLDNAKIELQRNYNLYYNQEKDFYSQINNAKDKIQQARIDLNNAENQLNESKNLLNDLKTIVENKPFPLDKATIDTINKASIFDQNLPTFIYVYLTTKDEVTLGMLNNSFNQIESKLNDSTIQIDNGYQEVNNQENELNNKRNEGLLKLNKVKGLLDDSQNELNNGYKEYEVNNDKAMIAFKQTEKDLSNALDKINSMTKPKLYTITRDDYPGYAGYHEDAKRIDAISKVFPVFFIVVALLVCLTTMSRMVEEQRIQIGTLKALGYSKIHIISKFLIYASLATILGSLLGLFIGFNLLPKVIFNAYKILYNVPVLISPFRIDYAFWCTAVALICTLSATIYTSYYELTSNPAKLMRPKSPKVGKRVFLERIPFIWNRLKFLKKVTIRNIFRYKKRILMTIIGISGCTALILSGLGLKDSISDIGRLQFEEINIYNGHVALKENANINEVKSLINKESYITNSVFIHYQTINISNNDIEKNANLVITNDKDNIVNFINFRERITKKPISLTDEGVIITEKASKLLGVKEGETITIKIPEKGNQQVKIIGIMENYAHNYIYMTENLYKTLYNVDIKYNTMFINTKDKDINHFEDMATTLLKNENILGIENLFTSAKDFNDILGSLDKVVYVTIISAGLLAFIVLYNLTNINVNERIRELATIKVLGFYDGEVSSYIYRENTAATLIGAFLGLIFGIFLHQFIIVTAEVDMVMFGRTIVSNSYIIALLLTFSFTFIVNAVLHFRLKKINMVDSLKAIE